MKRWKKFLKESIIYNKKVLQLYTGTSNKRLIAVMVKPGRYDNRTSHFKQNCLFESNQNRLFDELDGRKRDTVILDVEKS